MSAISRRRALRATPRARRACRLALASRFLSLRSRRGAAADARSRRWSSPARASRRRSAAARPTSSSSTPTTIRNTSADSVEDLLRRDAGMQLIAQRRPGPELGLLHPRREHEQHRRARRRRPHRLGDARPGRVRGAEPGADRAHRDPARAGVEPLRRRRGRRRRPDLHPPRRRRAARRRRRPTVGGYRSRRGDVGASGSQRRLVDYAALARPREQPRRLGDRARRPVRQLQPRPRRLRAQLGHRCGSASRRRRATASASPARDAPQRAVRRQPSSPPTFDRSFARLPQSADDARRVARLPRQAGRPSWTTTLQARAQRRRL